MKGTTMRRFAPFAALLLASTLSATEPETPAGKAADVPYTESITVVGTRIAPAPERIPGSVTVLDSATLETARPLTTCEALRKSAGVTARDEEGLGLRPNIGLRGTNPTRSSKVLLLEDGLPLTYAPYGDNATYYHPPIERFESIEIVKGSGQIAYGPMTVGGVINYVTPMPPREPSVSLVLASGSRDYRNAHLSFGGTWGATGAIVDVMRKEGSGSRDNTSSEVSDLNAKVVHTISAAQSLTLRANYYAEDSNVTYSGLRQSEYESDPRQNPFANDYFFGDRYGASVAHRIRLNDATLVTTSVYGSFFKRHWWRQSSNSNQRPNDAADPACGGMSNLNSTCGNEGKLREYRTWGVEPRIQWTSRLFGLPSFLEAGLRAHVESQDRMQMNGDTPEARSGRVVEDNARDNVAFAAFVQDRITIGRLSVTPGLRIERISYDRLNRLTGAAGRTDLTQIVPGLGLSWTAGQTTVFGGIHRGFAPPRTEDIISNGGGVIDLDPELSWNSELGIRSSIRPGLSAEATIFRMDYENQIVPASVAGGIGATLTNGGATQHEGAEISARADSAALFGTAHNAYATIAYTHVWEASFRGRRTSSVPGFTAVSVSGNRLPYAPERTVTAGLGYLLPRGVELFVEGVHMGEQFADDLNTFAPTADGQRGIIASHTTWNATLNYEVKAIRSTLFVAVKNVFDELYIVDRTRGILPGMPRVVQMGMKYRY
ncbi:MAG TPA: TonB-dependent receptor [Thermoanaerobaculia bacterium]|nr:TonB-dependent receptor [Thermoanaerobaculia bacterium]